MRAERAGSFRLHVPSHASPPTEQRAYRPDIDGLRAVAVLGVLSYHAAPNIVPGGFTGVDVFFVISGYLITGIILRAMEQQSFSSLSFYARRVKRIFPALIATLVVVWALSWPVLLWDEYQTLGKHIMAGAAFASNLVLYTDFDWYFGATTTPLIHLWSLGVEEQFYILWPVVLLALWKKVRPWWRIAAISLIAAMSFYLNVATLSTDMMASFYLPSNRIWELASGSALAYLQLYECDAGSMGRIPPIRPLSWARNPTVRGLAGTALIVVSFSSLHSNLSFPGWWALIPCVGTLLVISSGPESWLNRHLLATTPMIYIGLISYPLYLWHWPLLSIGRLVWGNATLMPPAAICTAFILAILTYKYIELPIRSARSTALIAWILCAAMVVCGGLGYLVFIRSIQARSASYDLDRFIRAKSEDWLSEDRHGWTRLPKGILTLGDGSRRVLFIGDSNMQQYYPRIEKVLKDHPTSDRSAIFAVRAGCAPAVIDLLKEGPETSDCKSLLQSAMKYADDPHVESVVIAAYWRGYAAVDWRDFSSSRLKPNTDDALENLKRMIVELVGQGKRVYIVLNIPNSHSFEPRQMIRRSFLSPGFTIKIHSPTRTEVERIIGPISSRVRQIAQDSGAHVIDPMDYLCDEMACPSVGPNGELIYFDSLHLLPSYARDNVLFLDETVLDVQRASLRRYQ
jgi:peptidoglycan/LPS O-acetylase OafA/YrhL